MSPFSEQLRTLRLRYGVRQNELADAIGVDQTYYSRVELGKKGPPSESFVDLICQQLRLSSDEISSLNEALRLLQRHLVIPPSASSDVFRMCNELWRELDGLTNAQVRAIRAVIEVRQEVSQMDDRPVLGRVVRSDKEAGM
ncbi:helix-turn-helix domain-containing protein [Burkholderia cenocepacia]